MGNFDDENHMVTTELKPCRAKAWDYAVLHHNICCYKAEAGNRVSTDQEIKDLHNKLLLQ